MILVLFYGSKDRERILKSEKFSCPNCAKDRYGTHRRIESWYTFFFIPLFRMGVVADYLKCRDCRHSYLMPEMTPFLPRGGLLASDLRVELRSGAAIERVESRLIATGLDPESARGILKEIVGPRLRSCSECQLTYQGNVVTCWDCGRKLGEDKSKVASDLDDFV